MQKGPANVPNEKRTSGRDALTGGDPHVIEGREVYASGYRVAFRLSVARSQQVQVL